MDIDERYGSIGKVYSPYFKEYIYFTPVGLEHLKFKNRFTARTEKDKRMRTNLLPIAVKIIEQSHTLQNRQYRKRFEERHINNRKEKILLLVSYFEFIAIIDNFRATVIIKQIENMEKVFLSVIPTFKQKMPPEESDIL